jgi:hypothetical protein
VIGADVAQAANAAPGVSVISQVEIIEGISAIVVLVAMLWLLGAGKLVIGRHYDDLKGDRDRWRDLYLDRLRNGRRQDQNARGGG